MAQDLTFAASRSEDAVVVRLDGEFDMSATFWLEPELERLTEDGDVGALVLDMEGVYFLDSAALGMLLSTQARLQGAGKRLVVANPSPAVRRILGVTGTGPTIGEARKRAYAGVERITFAGAQFRRDIALVASGAPG